MAQTTVFEKEKVATVVDVPPEKIAKIHPPIKEVAVKSSVIVDLAQSLFRIAGCIGIVLSIFLFWQSSMIQGIFYDYANTMQTMYRQPSIAWKAQMRRIESTKIASDSAVVE